MNNCININHPEVLTLSSELNLPKIVIASKIALWQEQFNTYDRFPTNHELFSNSIVIYNHLNN